MLTLIAVLVISTVRRISPATPKELPEIERGARLYSAQCATCHGQNREGIKGIGGALNTHTLKDYTHPALENIILFGVPDKGMPAFQGKISHGQMHYLEKFILQPPAD